MLEITSESRLLRKKKDNAMDNMAYTVFKLI